MDVAEIQLEEKLSKEEANVFVKPSELVPFYQENSQIVAEDRITCLYSDSTAIIAGSLHGSIYVWSRDVPKCFL
jgi:hypothetical protein